jgi:hypothetical protein
MSLLRFDIAPGQAGWRSRSESRAWPWRDDREGDDKERLRTGRGDTPAAFGSSRQSRSRPRLGFDRACSGRSTALLLADQRSHAAAVDCPSEGDRSRTISAAPQPRAAGPLFSESAPSAWRQRSRGSQLSTEASAESASRSPWPHDAECRQSVRANRGPRWKKGMARNPAGRVQRLL